MTNSRPLAISEIAFLLGLLEDDVLRWLRNENPAVSRDHRNRPCVDREYLEILSQHPEYIDAKRRSLNSEKAFRLRESGSQADELKDQRLALLESYQPYISDLENVHRNCLERINNKDHESCITAAYLLLSRAISSLKMGCLLLEHGYWYGGSVIREIDETLDLAHYFVLANGTEQGAKHLKQWFRQNRAPKHNTCREYISRKYADLIPNVSVANHKDLMNELYQAKSKWTHPVYSSIREITSFDTSSSIAIEKIDYGEVSFQHKLLELAEFFRSSIWTTFQMFNICFAANLPLNQDEISMLSEYDRFFQNVA